ncbi:ribosome-associated translation inhibitor RaiA [Patescibacteria group bacterium]|jgi:ribosomal subunit interface protein|nr:ribosome-associated translation inhibitor RaiA [Patescibacteria group bacterium]
MNITHTALNVEVSDELKAYAEKRFADCEKLLRDAAAAICGVEYTNDHAQEKGAIYQVKVNLDADGTRYHAEATEESFEAAVDKVKDEVLKELRRAKEKREDAVRKGGLEVKEALREG